MITHYLKLASSREKLEQERLRTSNKLDLAKVEQIESSARVEQLYAEALKAMQSYQGTSDQNGIKDPNVQ